MPIGPLVEDDVLEVSEILGAAFAYPAADTPSWLDQGGRDNVRVLRDGGRPVACLLEVPMGHFFGRESVPTCGIAGVGVALERRRQGHARTLMREVIEEIAGRRCALSTLYPATQRLYRTAGYERAGKLVETRIPLASLVSSTLDPGKHLEVRRLDPSDAPAVEAAYAAVARDKQGWLDRGPYIWSRVRTPRSRMARGFGFFAKDGALEGHVYMTQEPARAHQPWHDVRLTDCVATTPGALGAIVRFLHDQRSTARELVLRGGPSEPLLSALDEADHHESSEHDWMLRIAHVESALAARGYPAHVTATVELDVSDDLIAANRGRFTLDVREGRGAVTRGGAGRAKLDVLALAPLYAGYLGARTLGRLGRLEADDATLERLASIFGGPMPSMGEMF